MPTDASDDRSLIPMRDWNEADYGGLVRRAIAAEQERFAPSQVSSRAPMPSAEPEVDGLLAGLVVPDGSAELALRTESSVAVEVEKSDATAYSCDETWDPFAPVPDHLLADWELYEELRAAGFRGPRFEMFLDDLWRYGLRTMKSWLYEGTVTRKAAQRQIWINASSVEREIWARSSEVREELACNTVADAMVQYTRSALTGGGWHPQRGAGLRTFFIGACLLAFRDVYRAWSGQRRRQLQAQAALVNMAQVAAGCDPADVAVQRDTLTAVLKRATPEARAICALIYRTDGTYAEIGRALGGMSARAVEGQMHRLRRTLKDDPKRRPALPPGSCGAPVLATRDGGDR